MHCKLDSDIADTRSLLNTSAQATKNLKIQLKELTEKKKDAGKSPRKSQAGANKFNIPIPKIQGITSTILSSESTPTTNSESDTEMQKKTPIADIQVRGISESESESTPTFEDDLKDIEMGSEEITHVDVKSASVATAVETASTLTSESNLKAADSEMLQIAPINVPGQLVDHTPTHELLMFKPPVPSDALVWTQAVETINNGSEEMGLTQMSRYTSHWHPGFELPPLDLELLNATLENEPIPEPTAAEVAAYLFLRESIGN